MKLNIFGRIIKVRKKKGLSNSTGWAGYYDPTKKEIVIDASLTGHYMTETFIHEFLEAVHDRCSHTQVLEPQAKELMIDMISKALNENFILKKR